MELDLDAGGGELRRRELRAFGAPGRLDAGGAPRGAWVKGWYDQTLNNATIEKYGLKKIGIVFIDCDTYSSSRAVLDFVGPLITEPAIICLDDWKLNNLDIKGMGEYKSFNEFLEKNSRLVAEEIKSYNRKSKSFLVKPAH